MDEKVISSEVDAALSCLRSRVEECVGFAPTTPRRFETLVASIFSRTGVLLSATTLKRLWGYLKESTAPRQSTLDVLARYCGWTDFKHFLSGCTPEIESGVVGKRIISVDKDLIVGDRLRLLWPPSRMCEIEYLGLKKWKVLASEKTRITPGDTFSCAFFISGEPLYLDDFTHDGEQQGVYVCGRRSGVTFMLLGYTDAESNKN